MELCFLDGLFQYTRTISRYINPYYVSDWLFIGGWKEILIRRYKWTIIPILRNNAQILVPLESASARNAI